MHSRENFSLKIDTPDQTKAISLYSTEIEIGGSLSLKIDKMASVRDHCSNYLEVCSRINAILLYLNETKIGGHVPSKFHQMDLSMV